MKVNLIKYITSLILTLNCFTISISQETYDFNIDTLNISSTISGSNFILVELEVIGNDVEFHPVNVKNSEFFLAFKSEEGLEKVSEIKGITVTKNNSNDYLAIQFKFLEPEVVKQMAESGKEFHLIPSDPINGFVNVALKGDESLNLRASDFETKPIPLDGLSKELLSEYEKAVLGTISYRENHIDLDVIPKQDGANQNQIGLDFYYAGGWKFLKTAANHPVSYNIEGFVSSDLANPQNQLKIVPISFSLFQITKPGDDRVYKPPTYLNLNAGLEGDQTFSYSRMAFSLDYMSLIPNLVDLTGGADRLRLKPILSGYVKYYNEFTRSDTVKQNSETFQFGAKLHYYVPVLEQYGIVVNANAFYDLNEVNNPKNEIGYMYDIGIYYEPRGTKAKLMASYKKGDNDVTYNEADFIQLGIKVALNGQ